MPGTRSTTIGGLPVVVGILTLAVVGCGGPAGPMKRVPSPEERVARKALVDDHPELDGSLARDLLSFRVSPTDALRRQAYVDANRGLDAGLRRAVLGGWVTRRMTPAQVRAAWGEPDDRQDRSQPGRPTEVWVYRRAVSPYDARISVSRLRFEGRMLVDIQVDAFE